MLNLIYFDPAAFCPNVMLRPICQDYLFPTVAYVGGGSEISYFAQVIPNYDFFNIVTPIIFPRASATILESHLYSIIEKYQLSLRDFFIDENILIGRGKFESTYNRERDIFSAKHCSKANRVREYL